MDHTHQHLDEAVDQLHERLTGIDRRLGGIDDRLDRITGNDVPHASRRSWAAVSIVVIMAAARVLEELF